MVFSLTWHTHNSTHTHTHTHTRVWTSNAGSHETGKKRVYRQTSLSSFISYSPQPPYWWKHIWIWLTSVSLRPKHVVWIILQVKAALHWFVCVFVIWDVSIMNVCEFTRWMIKIFRPLVVLQTQKIYYCWHPYQCLLLRMCTTAGQIKKCINYESVPFLNKMVHYRSEFWNRYNFCFVFLFF